jgi:peptidoglycan hydrolase-like protein with peptidoglycan-binding domain
LDGNSGPGTINAIRRYQTKYKLVVNGTPSTEFLTRMIAKRLSDTIQPASGTPESASDETPDQEPTQTSEPKRSKQND